MSVLEVNGIKFHYWTTGEGPDMILIHGLGGNLAIWHLKLVPLLRKNFRVTTYDLRGHGKTGMPLTGYTTADMVCDLKGLLDGIGIEQAHLIGHSLGADIALHFALRHPERVQKLVLMEAALPVMIQARLREDWIGWKYWCEMIEKFTGEPVPAEQRSNYDYLLRQILKVPILFGPARGHTRKQDKFLQLLETTTLVQDYEVADDLTMENIAIIPHPKLLLYDPHSPYLDTYRALREIVMNSVDILLPPSELRHFFPLEQPEILEEYISIFLDTELLQAAQALRGRANGR